MPNPRSSPSCVPCCRSNSAQKAWIVPRFTRWADWPRPSSREPISSAALLVKVKALMRAGSRPTRSIRYRIRSMRQYVLPAPGPASTSAGPGGASIAASCDVVGLKPFTDIRLALSLLGFYRRGTAGVVLVEEPRSATPDSLARSTARDCRRHGNDDLTRHRHRSSFVGLKLIAFDWRSYDAVDQRNRA